MPASRLPTLVHEIKEMFLTMTGEEKGPSVANFLYKDSTLGAIRIIRRPGNAQKKTYARVRGYRNYEDFILPIFPHGMLERLMGMIIYLLIVYYAILILTTLHWF